jgi:hypothetical protein
MVKTAGSRDHSKQERAEMDRFWLPLGATRLPTRRPKRTPSLPPLSSGKRPRPGNGVAGDPNDWATKAQLPLGAQRGPSWQRRKHADNVAGDPKDWATKAQLPLGTHREPSWQQRKHADAPMETSKGKPKRRLMSPSSCVNFHPFTETLRDWEEGVPVDCGEDWTSEMVEAAIQQGPHKSALMPETIALIEEDVAYQV